MKSLLIFFKIICLFSLVSVSLSEVFSQNPSISWIEMLTGTDDSTQQKAKQQLLSIIWQNTVQPLVKKLEDESKYFHAEKFEKADILLSDIDGNGSKEIIASISVPGDQGEDIGYVIVMDENLSIIRVIEVGVNPVMTIINLLGEDRPAIIIESGWTHSCMSWNGIRIYQWEQDKLNEIWSGIISEMGGIDRYDGAIRARIQIVDLDRDGIREIVRIGEGYLNEPAGTPADRWFLREGDQELIQAKVEKEFGSIMNVTTERYPKEISISPEIDFEEIDYQLAYRFREVFFWNKHFKRYIQYVAHIAEDTTAYIGSESVPVVSGTSVGVLSSLSADGKINWSCKIPFDDPIEGYIMDDLEKGYRSDSIAVVLPDGRIGKILMEKILR